MQQDLFAEPTAQDAKATLPPAITLLEDASSDYQPRTGKNARSAEVTVAFATDFETAGERLTKRVAGVRYVGIYYDSDVDAAAAKLIAFMQSRRAHTLNVAGNGIYTLARKGVSQDEAQRQVNRWVYEVLRRVHQAVVLTHIRSGGQTGVDVAGLVAGIALKIPVTGLWPKGYRQRLVTSNDVSRDVVELEQELKNFAAALG